MWRFKSKLLNGHCCGGFPEIIPHDRPDLRPAASQDLFVDGRFEISILTRLGGLQRFAGGFLK